MIKCLFLGSILLISGCAVQVKTHQKTNTDFSSFHTWCWLQGCEVKYHGPNFFYNKSATSEIANAIAVNMTEKGYIQDDQKPDLVLNFYVKVEKDSSEAFYENVDLNQREHIWAPTFYHEHTQFMKGSLIIDVIRKKDSELVWSSSSLKYLKITPDYNKEAIWKGIKRALKKFPDKNHPKAKRTLAIRHNRFLLSNQLNW